MAYDAFTQQFLRNMQPRLYMEADTLIGREGGKAMGALDPTPVADILADPLKYGIEPGEWKHFKSVPCSFAPEGSGVPKGHGISLLVLPEEGKVIQMVPLKAGDYPAKNMSKKGDHWVFIYQGKPTKFVGSPVPDGSKQDTVKLDENGKIDFGDAACTVTGFGRDTRAFVFRADTGQGKTEVVSKMTRIMREGDRKNWSLDTKVLTPTRSLSWSASSRFGIGCYLEHEASKGAAYYLRGSMAFCGPSATRAMTFDNEPDEYGNWKGKPEPYTLVLDESEQLIRALLTTDDKSGSKKSSKKSGRQSSIAFHSMLELVRNADAVFAMDAHAGGCTQLLFELAGLDPSEVGYIDTPRNNPRSGVRYGTRDELVAQMREDLKSGERPVCLVHSVTEAETMARLVQGDGFKAACVTRNTVHDFDLSNINGWVTDYDAMFYTPVIGTGVSIDVNHFTRLYALLRNRQGTADDLQQQLDRVRPLMNSPVHFYAEGGVTPEPWEFDEDLIRLREQQRLVAGNKASRLEAGAITAQSLTDDTLFNRMVYRVHASEVRRGKGRAVDQFFREQIERGATVVDAQPVDKATVKATSVERKAVKAEVKHDQKQEIIDATAADDDLALSVNRVGPKSSEELTAVKRRGVERFYGPDVPVDHDLLDFDREGRGRTACRSLVHVMALKEGGGAADMLRALDHRETELQIPTTKLSHHTLAAMGLAAVLGRAGLLDPLFQALGGGVSHQILSSTSNQPTSGVTPSTIPLDPDLMPGLVAWATDAKTRYQLSLTGIKVPTKIAENPVRFVSDVLKRVGITLQSKQHRVNGVRTRTYWIDVDEARRTWEYATAYRERFQTGVLIGSDGDPNEIEADPFDQHLARQRVNQAITEAGLEALLTF